MVYELLNCDVAPGKRPDLLQRFERFTARRWRELGFHLVGCWMPVIGAKSSQLVILLHWEDFNDRARKTAAWDADPERMSVWEETEQDGPLVERTHQQLLVSTAYSPLKLAKCPSTLPTSRLFELRTYEAMPGRQQDVIDRFEKYVCGAFDKHGFHQVGYWTNAAGGHDHQLIYMLTWSSLDEREARFAAFLKDPERIQVFAEQERNGAIVQQSSNTILRPTAFSPLN